MSARGARTTARLAVVLIITLNSIAFGSDLPVPHRRHVKRVHCHCPKPPPPPSCKDLATRLAPVANTIEATVIIRVASVETCFLPQSRPLLIKTGQPTAIFVRLVYSDNLLSPINGREIRLDVIDSFGSDSPVRSLSTSVAKTGFNGFPVDPIFFTAQDPGVYRIRAIYSDREIINFSMSPNIIVSRF
jgi:hypothetical protein